MKAIKLGTQVPKDRTLSLRLPEEMADGPKEVIVLLSEPGRALPELFAEGLTLARRLWNPDELERYLRGDERLKALVSELRQRLGDHLRQVVLFGSRARGDHRPDSDYDCLAVVDAVSPAVNDAVDEAGGELLVRYSAVFSILPVAESAYRESADPLFVNARREGISLWENPPKSIA